MAQVRKRRSSIDIGQWPLCENVAQVHFVRDDDRNGLLGFRRGMHANIANQTARFVRRFQTFQRNVLSQIIVRTNPSLDPTRRTSPPCSFTKFLILSKITSVLGS